MKWIKIPINFPSFNDLVQQARDYLRRSLVTVNSLPDRGGKPLDREKPRPWHVLPSIRGFRIELSPNDWLLTLFGLRKRFPNRMEFDAWKNDDANQYVDYMFDRISKEVELKKYKQAWNTIWILMNSPAYQVTGLNHVLKNWHRNIPLRHVKRIMKQVQELASKRATGIDYSRVYLQETHKIRPLGVPTMSWRIYLHLLNNCLVQWRLVTEGRQQHGYFPKRGVITAWREICQRLNAPNIYEADYKQFFPSVSLPAIRVSLLKTGFPLVAALFLEELNSSQPKLPRKELLDESHTKKEKEFHEERRKAGSNPKLSSLMYTFNEHKDWAKTIPSGRFRGVPQGAPTSCSLATWVLRSLYDLDIILYADDIIYFPKSSDCDPVKDLSIPKWGINVHRDKSRWLKKDGVWLVDSFKFLGIRYYPPRKQLANTLSIAGLVLQYLAPRIFVAKARFVAETRKGANLEFSDRESFLSYLAIARELLLDSKYLRGKVSTFSLQKWLSSREAAWLFLSNKAKLLFGEVLKVGEDLVTPEYFRSQPRIIQRWLIKERGLTSYKNPLSGYFLSRMQSNSWSLSHEQDFRLSYREDSWIGKEWASYSWRHLLPRAGLNVFTSSSFAIHDFLECITRRNSRMRKPKSVIRRVVTNSPRPEWYQDAVRLRAAILSEKVYDKPDWRLPESAAYSIPYEYILILCVDLVLGAPIFTGLMIWVWASSRKWHSSDILSKQFHIRKL